jgi:hypothetical protein
MSLVPRKSLNGLPVLTAAVATNDEQVVELLADEQGFLITATAVWNPDTEEWEAMVQPTLEATISGITIEGETQYKDSRFDYDSDGYVVYAGENEVMNASESSTDWILYKMYYDLDGNTVQIKSQVGSWQDRATLVWE